MVRLTFTHFLCKSDPKEECERSLLSNGAEVVRWENLMGLLLRKRSQDDGASFSERLSSSPSEQSTQVWSTLPCSSLEHLCPELWFPCSSRNRLFLVTRARLSLPPSRLTETHRASHVTWGQAPHLSLPQRRPLCPGVRLPARVRVGRCLTQGLGIRGVA